MADSLNAATVVQRVDTVMSNSVDGDLVMMDVERGSYYGLDRIGTDIWNRLEKPTSVRALCEALRTVYRVEPATCERDVLHLLGQMHDAGLIRVMGPE